MNFYFVSTMDGWQWGGSEELWSQSASLLKSEGHNVQASVARFPLHSDKVAALVRQGIEVEARGGQPRNLWRKLNPNARKGFDRLKGFNPDLVIISQGYNAGGFDWAKSCIAAGIPYAVIVQCNYENWWFTDDTLDDAVTTYTHAHRVFCVSHSNLELLRIQSGETLSNAEIVWNPYSVSPERAPAWPAKDDILQLACVARIEPTAKGQDLLFRIFARDEWRKRPVHINLYGAGYYERSMRRMAEMLHVTNISFQGHVHNVESIWAANHILILPSRYEGLPLALVEAMWCARPAILTDVGGNPELCVEGETGFIAAAPTVAAVADAMERAWLHRGEWQSMGRAARARAEALVPRNPIELFAGKLKACAAGKSGAAQPTEVALQGR
jgi:glycosyltransferase involved in cell wall biosynthesis